jgi:hypothetical protein
MSLIAATQWTAVATIVLATFAIVTAVFAILAFRKQSTEVTTLQKQFDDQRKVNAEQAEVLKLQAADLRESLDERQRDREQRHRDQARLISAVVGPEEESGGWAVPERTGIDLINSSPEPVYRLVVAIVSVQGAGMPTIERRLEYQNREKDIFKRPQAPITTASILPSGTYRVWIAGRHLGVAAYLRYGAEVAFTDRAGSHWIRRATGQLEELPEDPILHYLGRGPHDLHIPERAT